MNTIDGESSNHEVNEPRKRQVLIPIEERDDFSIRFIRRGTTKPTDFADRVIRQHYQTEARHDEESTWERAQKLYDHYKNTNKLVEFMYDDVVTTPLLIREYRVGDEKLNVGVGIGHSKSDDNELDLVVATWERGEVMLVALPENGVEDIPATHGVDELLGWMENLYPRVYG